MISVTVRILGVWHLNRFILTSYYSEHRSLRVVDERVGAHRGVQRVGVRVSLRIRRRRTAVVAGAARLKQHHQQYYNHETDEHRHERARVEERGIVGHESRRRVSVRGTQFLHVGIRASVQSALA
ncbi:hypothetical protein [Olene mendosa nucleopolyhedrovirus]|uniref:Secreted protein n=1 Tax=Olene mendosa nucleopolyhedrovirus TaxID=2933796 RepID=A0AAX3AV26_9ABAC|nr:hypothetical protein QKV28_gp014 [Olene mendosa nucleopolyhedrovirus]UOQ18797.1 hypothetical protein [Olene mendosa nucleopolyhedrovirus]